MVTEKNTLLNEANSVPKRAGKVWLWLIVTITMLFLPIALDFASISLSKFLDGSKTDKGTMFMLRMVLSVGVPLLLALIFTASIDDSVFKKSGVTLFCQALLVILYFLVMVPLVAYIVYSIALLGNGDSIGVSVIIRICIALLSIPVIAIALAIAAYLAAVNHNREIPPACHAATIVIPVWLIQLVCVWVMRGL